ncbi:MAG: tyrosine-type recombinase/integrase [Selenomonadaceae bacterium]|nr:tyrosine-type recombinase/integrase [Selenomonadaceae bacterium]
MPTKHLPHDGRHTCATLLDDAKVPLKIQQLILGHSSPNIANPVYTHKTIQQLIDAINRI